MHDDYGNYPWLDAFLLSLPGAEKEFQLDWQAMKYMINGKLFVMLGGDKEGKTILTLKLEPAHGELLRKEYDDIVPGYYMNKTHWNSVYLYGTVAEDFLKDLIRESHGLIFASLPKKVQQSIQPLHS